jgi:hypothetical protein
MFSDMERYLVHFLFKCQACSIEGLDFFKWGDTSILKRLVGMWICRDFIVVSIVLSWGSYFCLCVTCTYTHKPTHYLSADLPCNIYLQVGLLIRFLPLSFIGHIFAYVAFSSMEWILSHS